MTITYTFSPEMLRKGAAAHLMHRQRIITLLFPILGIAFLVLGARYLFFTEDPVPVLGAILVAFGAFYLIRYRLRTSSAVKEAFRANPTNRQVTLVTTDQSASITDGENSGTCPWASFVDFKICKSGLLIYPQKNIFYWIPDNAETEGGTWQDFTALVSSKITKKI